MLPPHPPPRPPPLPAAPDGTPEPEPAQLEEARARLRAELIRDAGGSHTVIDLTAPPTAERARSDRDVTFRSGDWVSPLPATVTSALDVRDKGELASLRAARRLQIPVVSGFHTNFQQYTGHYGFGLLTRLLTNYLRWFHNRSQMTLVPSVSQQIELQRRGFDNLELLSRGVDSQLFHPAKRCAALRERWGLAEQDIAILHVGRLAAEKNLALLSKSFQALQQAHPQRRLKLILVGDGPQRASLQQQLPEAVFCGLQRGEELAAHYASGDLFVFPSLSETFGNVVLEALASGLGVVAFDQAAAAQHIRHGHNGALAVAEDEQGFIDAASWLLTDHEGLRRVRLNARLHASRQGWPAIVELFEQHLRSAMQPVQALPAGRTQH